MVVHRRCYGEPIAPIVLLIGGQVSQEQFYPLILPFRDSICLGMEGRGYVLFYAETLTQCFGKMGRKTGVPIRDDFSWQSEPAVHMFMIEGCYSFSRDGGFVG